MSDIRIANAPCSWGVMKGFGGEGGFPPFERVLDEIAASGYEGTELGDWGYLPTGANELRPELEKRGLALVGALVPLALADRRRHEDCAATALRTARLLAACVNAQREAGPFIVLADDNGADPVRTQFAGRVRPEHGLGEDAWRAFSDGVNMIARRVRDETGLRTVFHHHCAGFVETPNETLRLLDSTDPSLVGLCFDTGHWAYAGGDPVGAMRLLGDRVWHVHFKDCHPAIAERSGAEKWDYFTAVRNGVFYGLGGGEVDFASVLNQLRRTDYRGWIVVEDELPPGMGDPLESARRDREYLRGLGI